MSANSSMRKVDILPKLYGVLRNEMQWISNEKSWSIDFVFIIITDLFEDGNHAEDQKSNLIALFWANA